MHEMALTQGVRKILEQEAERQGFTTVRKVWLDIGELSHVEPEAMKFCFQAVMHGSLAGNAELVIVRSPGTAWCMDCSDTIAVKQRFDPCPHCGGHKLQVTGGEEMRIKELEVD